MTRFMLTLEEGIDLVKLAFRDMRGGEIYVKKIPSMKVIDIARAVNSNAILENVGVRPGEKIHEQMISVEDAPFTYEYNTYYKILPYPIDRGVKSNSIQNGKLVPPNFSYSSDSNSDWMDVLTLKKWITKNFQYPA